MTFLGKILKSILRFLKSIFLFRLRQKNKEAVEEKKIEDVKKNEKPEYVEKKERREKGGYTSGVLLSPHVTEKSTNGNALNKYVFRVANTANKPEIKKAVEGKYGVNVLNVRVLNTKPKSVRLGRTEGTKPGYKKAIVTLAQGDKIEIGV